MRTWDPFCGGHYPARCTGPGHPSLLSVGLLCAFSTVRLRSPGGLCRSLGPLGLRSAVTAGLGPFHTFHRPASGLALAAALLTWEKKAGVSTGRESLLSKRPVLVVAPPSPQQRVWCTCPLELS